MVSDDMKEIEGLEHILINTGLVDVVTQKIRNNIHTGRYMPGQKLVVRELAEELNISHTPVKEALNRLVAEGYVEARPRKSMTVRTVGAQEFLENMELRLMCELYIMPTVMSYTRRHEEVVLWMEEDIRQMQHVLDHQENLNYNQWLELDFQFHNRYVQTTNNQLLQEFYQNLKGNRISYFMFLNETKHPLTRGHLCKDNEEHQLITEAIRSGSTSSVVEAVSRHILRSRTNVEMDEETKRRIERVLKLYRYDT